VLVPLSEAAQNRDRLLPLALLSLIVGAATGLVGALFRLALNEANEFRDAIAGWSQSSSLTRVAGLFLLAILCAAATTLAAWLVRRFAPRASGSGIPHVEAVLSEERQPASFWVIPVKFAGGVLAIGAGLALGREGPSVQIGASLAHLCGKIFRRNWPDCRVLMAAGAGAGLATAFGAPIAGAVFVIEELVRRFETRIAVAALGASTTAMIVARLFLGDAPEFQVATLPYPDPQAHGLFLILGIVAGFVAVAYNKSILGAIGIAQKLDGYAIEVRAAVVGAAVGVLAWFAPALVGGGESLTQLTLDGQFAAVTLAAVFILRFVLGPVSYAARTPGGLFAPILILGAQLGLLFAGAAAAALPSLGASPNAFAVVGMAALVTGIVRAPVTGIVLITEMTGSFTMLLPMLGACFTAMLIPTLLNNAPIYTSLRDLDR
jgi:CIC family chloride channel protein